MTAPNHLLHSLLKTTIQALCLILVTLSSHLLYAQEAITTNVSQLVELPSDDVTEFINENQYKPTLSQRAIVSPSEIQLQRAKQQMNQVKNAILSKSHQSISFGQAASLELTLDAFGGILLNTPAENEAPLAIERSTSKTLVIEGNALDNTLTISKAIIDLGYDVLYIGGDQQTEKGDQLIVGNSSDDLFNHVEVTHYNANDGIIEIDGTSTITFVDLEPVTITGSTTLVITLPNTPNPDAVLQNGASAGFNTLSGSTFESTTFENPTESLTINGGTSEDLISIQGVDTSFGADLIVNANSDSDQISFDTNTTFVGVGEISVVAEFLSITANLGTEDDITLLADKNIEISNGARVSTSLGDIVITSGQDIAATDNFTGILINNGQVDSIDGGDITITGIAASNGSTSNNRGVNIANTSSIFTSDSSGAITIIGVGANGTVNNDGVAMSSNNASISAVGGDIVIQGTANGSGNNNAGFAFRGQITNTGGGTIDITAVSNGLGSGCRGMRIIDNNTLISTIDGNISINATAGPGNNSCQGVEYREGNITSEGGDVTIIGTGNGSGNTNFGLRISGPINSDNGQIQLTGNNVSTAGTQLLYGTVLESGANVTTQDGQININGTGGTGNNSFNVGVLMGFGSEVVASGTGSISITGNGGVSPQRDYGIFIQNDNTKIEANGGGITLNGTGGGNGSSRISAGIIIISQSIISEAGGGDIDITGTGGTGTDNNFGVFLAAGTTIQGQGGTVTINGTGTDGVNGVNVGFGMDTASITNNTNGNIFITGTGATGLETNIGALIDENSVISSDDGNIVITGTSVDVSDEGALVILSPIATDGNIDLIGTAASNTNIAVNIFAETGVVTAGSNLIINTLQGTINSPNGPATLSVCNGANIVLNGPTSAGNLLGQLQLTGALDFSSGVTLTFDVNDFAIPGTDYDQLLVNGTVDLTDVNLSLVDNTASTSTTLQALTLIDNDGTDAVVGQFVGIANGDAVSFNGETWYLYYDQGDGNDVVLLSAPINVIVDGSGNLVYTDALGDDDDLFLFVDGGNYRIGDANKSILAGVGAIQDGNEVIVPITSVTGNININTLNGNDHLTVDYSGGDFTDNINYNGGNQTTGDLLTLFGDGTLNEVTHTFINANDGSIAITGNNLLSYVGLEPVIDNLDVTNRIFTFTGGAETITLSDDGNTNDGFSFIDSTLGESVTFVNPIGTLTINAGNGNDTVNVEGLDGLFDADLTINGDDDRDNINFQNNPTSTANGAITINGESILVSENVNTTDAISLIGSSTVGIINNAILASTDGNITIVGGNAPAASDNLLGMRVDSGTVRTTGTGNISITGTGSFTGIPFRHGVQLRNAGVVETTGSGSITMDGTSAASEGAEGIQMLEGSRVESNGGGISLVGQAGNSALGGNKGLSFINGFIQDLNGGNIAMNGQGNGTGSNNQGVIFINTQAQVSTGTITVVGNGASNGIDNNFGVGFLNTSTVSASGGAISITGNGAGSGDINRGVRVIGSSSITNTGSGNITLNGSALSGVRNNGGVDINNGIISAVDGAILVTGNGFGDGTGDINRGIDIRNAANIMATGTGTITLNGTGGDGVDANQGIFIRSSGTSISAVDGTITLNGTSGVGTGNNNEGVTHIVSALIQTTGIGDVTITGNARGGNNNNKGLVVSGAGISTTDGNIDLNGTGVGTGNNNYGVQAESIAFISSTGDGAITITGQGGNGVNNNQGIRIEDAGTAVTTVNGAITLNGTSGVGTGVNNEGVTHVFDALIQTTGTGNVNVTGIASGGDDANKGIVLGGASITTANGNIALDGTGEGTGDSNLGISLESTAAILSTGTGSISLLGDGGNGVLNNQGIGINNSSVTSNGGGILATGTGGDSTGDSNIGVLITNGSQVRDTNGGTVNITGTGGDAVGGGHGIQISSASTVVETSNGTITFTGVGGNGTGGSNEGIFITQATIQDIGSGDITMSGTGGNATAFNRGFEAISGMSILSNGGDISLTGTGGNGSGNFNVGMSIRNNTPTVQTTGTGTITINGIGGVGAAANFGNEITGGAIVSTEDGSIDIVGIAVDTTGGNQAGLRLDGDFTSNSGDILLTGTSGLSNASALDFVTNDVLVQTGGDVILTANNSERIVTASGIPAANLIEAATITVNGNLQPGDNIRGLIAVSGALQFASDDEITFNIAGFTTPGTDFDQIVINGTIEITDAALTLVDNYNPTENFCGTIVLLSNDGTDAITGTFNGLPEGASVSFGGITGKVSYVGGDGNDFVLNLDNTPPVAICQDITVQLDVNGMAMITPADVDGGSTDNCGTASLAIDIDTFDCNNVGINTVTLTVTDVNGNSSTCTATVTVEDNVAPMAICQDITIQLDNNGMAMITPADIDAGSTDACGIASLSVNPSSFSCADVGLNTVTLTVTDVYGNSSTCTATVTVEDNIPTSIICPGNIEVDTTSSNLCSEVVDYDVFVVDNCLPSIPGFITLGATQDRIFYLSENPFTGAAARTDAVVNGGFVATITSREVQDFVKARINANGGGQAHIGYSDRDAEGTFVWHSGSASTYTLWGTNQPDNGGAGATDADYAVMFNGAPGAWGDYGDSYSRSYVLEVYTTGTLSQTAGLPSGSAFPVGLTNNTFEYTDMQGNMVSCSFDVTVIDNVAPTISCPTDLVTGTDPGLCSAQIVFSDAIANDACGIASVVQTSGLPSGSDFPVGVSTVEFTATDVNGNTTTCSFTITISDDEDPVAVCQDITIQLDEFGVATITAADVSGVSTDNCGVASTAIDIDSFDCSDVGANNVTLTVTDTSGNSSTCIAVVTVEDVTAPEMSCQNISVFLDENGSVLISPTDIVVSTSDACGVASMTLDIDTFDCSNIGENTVVVTVTDVNGNMATCTAIVTVEDNTSPELVCMDITVELDENGWAVITPEDVATFTDNCGIVTTAIDIFEFSCDDIGTPITVQVFANDSSGNLSSCFATVTVIDTLAPVITCPADQTVDPGPGNLFYEVPDYFGTGEATVLDNCTDPVTILSQDPAPGELISDGVYTVTLTAEDAYGNIGECTFELTVESVLGIEDNNSDISTIVMYPNPASESVIISNPQLIQLETVQVFDVTGRLVATYNLSDMNNEKTLDISALSSANYVVLISGPEGQIAKQLIKE